MLLMHMAVNKELRIGLQPAPFDFLPVALLILVCG